MREVDRRFRWLFLALLPSACSDPTSFVIVEPSLESLTARAFPFRFHGTWGLLVEGFVADGASELSPNARLPLRLSTTSGDEEELRLWPRVCESEDAGRHLCGTFLFSMRAGRHVGELRPLLWRLHGGLAFVGTSGSWANVWLFDSDTERAMEMVEEWPGVSSVSYDGLAFAGRIPPLFGPVVNVSPITFDRPEPGDGTVQARPGDAVTVRYSSAEGAEMIAAFTMCEASSGNEGTAIGGRGEDPPCG